MRIFKLFFCFLIFSHSPNKAIQNKQIFVSCCAASLTAHYFQKNIEHNAFIKKVASFLNITMKDFSVYCITSPLMWGSSFLTSEENSTIFLRLSTVIPLYLALMPKLWWQKIGGIPLLKQWIKLCSLLGNLLMGELNKCTNKECPSICNECKLRRLSQLSFVSWLGYLSTKSIVPRIRQTFFATEFERKAMQCSECLMLNAQVVMKNLTMATKLPFG